MKFDSSASQENQGVALADMLVSKLGHIFREQAANDVGIDAHVELVDEKTHEATGQLVGLQIKAGPSFLKEKTENGIVFRGSLDHLDYWQNHCLPIFLIVVDTEQQKAYWQQIHQGTAERLAKGWKVELPLGQELNEDFVNATKRGVGLVATSSSFTVLSHKDSSNAAAKRYSVVILARPPISRLRIEAIVRRATSDIKKLDFHRTKEFGEIFRGRDADVVWLYVGADLDDIENTNWVCRSMWVNAAVDPKWRPQSIGGIDMGDGLEIVWETDYSSASTFYKSLQIGKQEFLSAVDEFISHTEGLVAAAFSVRNITPEELAIHADCMRNLFLKSGDVGLAPFECKDVALRYQDVMAIADNAFLLALQKVKEKIPAREAEYLLECALRDFSKHLERLRYEVEKVR